MKFENFKNFLIYDLNKSEIEDIYDLIKPNFSINENLKPSIYNRIIESFDYIKKCSDFDYFLFEIYGFLHENIILYCDLKYKDCQLKNDYEYLINNNNIISMFEYIKILTNKYFEIN